MPTTSFKQLPLTMPMRRRVLGGTKDELLLLMPCFVFIVIVVAMYSLIPLTYQFSVTFSGELFQRQRGKRGAISSRNLK